MMLEKWYFVYAQEKKIFLTFTGINAKIFVKIIIFNYH